MGHGLAAATQVMMLRALRKRVSQEREAAAAAALAPAVVAPIAAKPPVPGTVAQ
jgi:hypothetical protein